MVDPLIGVVLDGRYRLDRRLGAGGMGAVYLGHHLAMDRPVAVKVIQPALARDEVVVRRLLREAKGTFKVDSPHAVRVLDCAVTAAGMPYVVLEYLDGRTLAQELEADGPTTPRRALRIMAQVAAALEAAHGVGLVHRDLKPENVMLVHDGDDPDVVKVLDFGLAKLVDDAPLRALSHAALTQAGVVFGTPAYMSPEQAMGLPIDERSDVYAAGVCLYELVVGRPPFVAEAVMEVLRQHVQAPVPALPAGIVGAVALDEILRRCLAKDPARRFASAREFGAAVRAAIDGASVEIAPRVAPSRRGPQRSTLLATDAASRPSTPYPARRRGLVIVVAACVVVAVGIVVASRARSAATSASAPVAAALDARPATPAPRPPPIDARPVSALDARRSAAKPVDARPAKPPPPEASHLAAAEAARRSGNHLAQLAEADEALRLAPGTARARHLVADALLATGDKPRACAEWKRIPRYRPGQQAARDAGCPID